MKFGVSETTAAPGTEAKTLSTPLFKRGDRVHKTGGDYTFDGWVVTPYIKLGGALRYIVEDARGLNLIMSEHQLRAGVSEARTTLTGPSRDGT